jgi:hypothetical protein
MRFDLQAMRRAGIKRCRFSAKIDLWDHRGFVALVDVVSENPVSITDHAWVKPQEWHGPAPRNGQYIDFEAEIRPYFKGNGIQDFGLFDVEVLR